MGNGLRFQWPRFVKKTGFGVAIGVNLGYGIGQDTAKLDQIAALGVTWVRLALAWDWIEPQQGVYDWDPFLATVDAFNSRGISVLLVTGSVMNPPYADPPNSDPGAGRHVPRTPSELAAYGNFYGLAAKMLGTRSVMYEIANELDWSGYTGTEYTALLKATTPLIRSQYSGSGRPCTIIGLGMVMDHMGYVKDCLAAGAFDYLDGCAVHPYGYGQPGQSPSFSFPPLSQLPSDYSALRTLLAGYPKVDIYATECGYSTEGDRNWDAFNPADQAQALVNLLSTNRACNIPLTIWYEFSDDANVPNVHERGFGVVDSNFVPKPSYAAMQSYLITRWWPFWPRPNIQIERSEV